MYTNRLEGWAGDEEATFPTHSVQPELLKRARAFKEKRDKQWKVLGMREMKADLHDAKAKRAKAR